MKRKIFNNMLVEYEVPDGVKVEDGQGLSAYVTLREAECKVEIKKEMPSVRKRSSITKFSAGNNTTLSFNTDDNIARIYVTLRPNEDWKLMEAGILNSVRSVYDQLLAFR